MKMLQVDARGFRAAVAEIDRDSSPKITWEDGPDGRIPHIDYVNGAGRIVSYFDYQGGTRYLDMDGRTIALGDGASGGLVAQYHLDEQRRRDKIDDKRRRAVRGDFYDHRKMSLESLEFKWVGMDPERPIVLPAFVTIVQRDHEYGGPEEGGWWYDSFAVIERHYVGSARVMNRLMDRLRENFWHDGADSWAGRVEAWIGTTPPRHDGYPVQRPRYE